MKIPKRKPSPLYKRIRAKGIALWQLRQMLGGSPSESYLSRTLTGIQPMPEPLEAKIDRLLEELDA